MFLTEQSIDHASSDSPPLAWGCRPTPEGRALSSSWGALPPSHSTRPRSAQADRLCLPHFRLHDIDVSGHVRVAPVREMDSETTLVGQRRIRLLTPEQTVTDSARDSTSSAQVAILRLGRSCFIVS